ncbi:hypothetical protein VN0965_07950 [Helicobacter pylori]
MLKIRHHIFFKKDFKKLVKNGFDDSVLKEVILTLRKKRTATPTIQRLRFKGSLEAL